MNSSVQDRLLRTGVAFALVGIVALCLSLTVLAPRDGTSGPTIGAVSFIVVGAAALGIWAVRRRQRSP